MASSLRYRAVLFDLDGTLVDSYTALAEDLVAARNSGIDVAVVATGSSTVGRFADLVRVVQDGAPA